MRAAGLIVGGLAVLGFGATCVGVGYVAGIVKGWRLRSAVTPARDMTALTATIKQFREALEKAKAAQHSPSSLPRTH
jgi:hypothetical protein